jgi:hypothetical protein
MAHRELRHAAIYVVVLVVVYLGVKFVFSDSEARFNYALITTVMLALYLARVMKIELITAAIVFAALAVSSFVTNWTGVTSQLAVIDRLIIALLLSIPIVVDYVARLAFSKD